MLSFLSGVVLVSKLLPKYFPKHMSSLLSIPPLSEKLKKPDSGWKTAGVVVIVNLVTLPLFALSPVVQRGFSTGLVVAQRMANVKSTLIPHVPGSLSLRGLMSLAD
jgi:hypothetical protein